MNRKQFLKQAILALVGVSFIPKTLQSKTESENEVEKSPYKNPIKFSLSIKNESEKTFYDVDLLNPNILSNRKLKVSYSMQPFGSNVSTYQFFRTLKEKPMLVRQNGVGIFYDKYKNYNLLIKRGEEIIYDFNVQHALASTELSESKECIKFYTNEVQCIIPNLEPNQWYTLICEIL